MAPAEPGVPNELPQSCRGRPRALVNLRVVKEVGAARNASIARTPPSQSWVGCATGIPEATTGGVEHGGRRAHMDDTQRRDVRSNLWLLLGRQ